MSPQTPQTSGAILALWDALCEKGAFPYSSFGYQDKLSPYVVVLTAFRSAGSWALVFEQVGFWLIDCPSSASNWVRVVRPTSDPEKAFDEEYGTIRGVVRTGEVTNDPAQEQTDDECVTQAHADAEAYGAPAPRFARLQEVSVELDGETRTLRPRLEDWRAVHAEVGPHAYAANKIAPHGALFRLAVKMLEKEVRLADPRTEAALGDDFVQIFRDDGPDVLAHLHDEVCHAPSSSPYWRALSSLLARESTEEPRRSTPIEHAIRRSLGLKVGEPIPEARLAEVTTLNLGDSSASDLAGIERLVNLEELHAYRTAITDLTPLQGLSKLRRVGLSSTQVKDVAPLGDRGRLQTLDLSYTSVSDLSPLRGVVIDDLRIGGTDVLDLSPLARKSIKYLGLEGTRITDLSPLVRTKHLSTLQLSGSAVVDLGPLCHLRSLTRLGMTSTEVTDVSPLAELPRLCWLSMRGAKVADLSPLLALPLREGTLPRRDDPSEAATALHAKGLR